MVKRAPRSRDPRLLFPRGVVAALVLFALSEVVAAVLLTRTVLPALVGGSGSSLTALRDQITLLIYGATLMSAVFMALMVGGWSRRSNRRTFSGLITSMVGAVGALGLALVVAVLTEQPIVKSTLLMHALVASIGVLGGTVLSSLPGTPRRMRLVQLVAVAICAACGWQLASPISSNAADDIHPSECRVETWSGSLGGGLTLFSLDVGLEFDFAAGRNLDGSWDLETDVSPKAGFRFNVGRKLKVQGIEALTGSAGTLTGVLSAANLNLEVKSDGLVTVSNRYRFESAEELRSAVVGSLATFVWHVQAVPGLAGFLGDTPMLPLGTPLPRPVETAYDVGTSTSISINLGLLSIDGELSSGLRVRFKHAKQASGGDPSTPESVDIGFPTSATLAVEIEAAVLPKTRASMERDLGGEVYTYLTWTRSNEDLTFEGADLEAVSVSATGWVSAAPDSRPGLGTSLITSMADEPGLAGEIGAIGESLGPIAAQDISMNVEARLTGLSDPQVVAALLTVVLLSVQVADAREYVLLTTTFPEVRQLTSRTAVVDALEVLIKQSDTRLFARSSSTLAFGLDVAGGTGLAFGHNLQASGGHEELVSAAVIAAAAFTTSKTCVAGG